VVVGAIDLLVGNIDGAPVGADDVRLVSELVTIVVLMKVVGELLVTLSCASVTSTEIERRNMKIQIRVLIRRMHLRIN